MIWRVFVFLFLWSAAANAAPVRVTSGEHDGFTRIVLDFGQDLDWQFGRVVDGYRFRPVGMEAQYDLGAVFQRIGTSRLASIAADPESSDLQIGFACACHAIPFQFRPGIIVIDLRDGPPPKGSSFENSLPEVQTPPPPPPKPKARAALGQQTYDWLQRFRAQGTKAPPSIAPDFVPASTTRPDLQPLRDQLLRQLSQGAGQGLIELRLPLTGRPDVPKTELQAARVALGELQGVQTRTARATRPDIGAQGDICPTNTDLAIAQWGGDDPTNVLLAQDMTALLGEFDIPDPDAVAKAVKTRLFLGFGQEARLLLRAFPADVPNAEMLTALSYLIDADDDPDEFFAAYGRCDTAAALWASLGQGDFSAKSQLNGNAVILAYSALPRHLRQHLGPRLIDQFLRVQDDMTAETLRNILRRSSADVSAEQTVAEANVDLAKGKPAQAEERLDQIDQASIATNAAAAIALVRARIDQGLPVDAQTVTLLSALQNELKGSNLAQEIAIALIHARAASGDFALAFAALGDQPNEAPIVWDLFAKLADDSMLLTYAIPAPLGESAKIRAPSAEMIAARILDLGLPDPALDWLNLIGQSGGVLRGKIELARKNGAGAIAALEGETGEEVALMRASAYAIMGNHLAAAQVAKDISPPTEVMALAAAKDWASLARGPRTIWQDLTAEVTNPPVAPSAQPDSFGPLARGRALADASAETRANIEQLFRAIAPPAP